MITSLNKTFHDFILFYLKIIYDSKFIWKQSMILQGYLKYVEKIPLIYEK